MPYQSHHPVEKALINATRFMQNAGCDAVKPLGGKSHAVILKAMVAADIEQFVKECTRATLDR